MPVIFQSASPIVDIDELDIPDPGPPPREEAAHSWAQVFQFLRKPHPDVKLEKAKDKVRWAWSNFTRHDKILRKAQIATQELDEARLAITVEHQAFMDVYESAIAETSKKQRKVEEKRLTVSAAKLQFRSLHFSKTTIDEISAQAAGRPFFPKRNQTTFGADGSIPGQHLTHRNRRYQRIHSLDDSNIHLNDTNPELSEDIAMQPLYDR
ncbi:hypothetical protein BDZ94DRAFT_1277891 [Collybia nuda]|uniref:Uncharacterized protein n=1 Tax=Collybia nuda TaxID=64659 RepID=A0A9P5XS63_9AGAR|nr:hypothetical protein BDZ94DRAFT_1277891 [Collybia nuda]